MTKINLLEVLARLLVKKDSQERCNGVPERNRTNHFAACLTELLTGHLAVERILWYTTADTLGGQFMHCALLVLF